MASMSIQSDLLAEIDAFCAERGIPPSTFGKRAINDGRFVGRLRGGSGVTGATVDRIRAYIEAERKRSATKTAA